jgi:hypothetical protein
LARLISISRIVSWYFKCIVVTKVDFQAHVNFELFFEAIANLTCGNKFTLTPCKGRVIYQKCERDGWLINSNGRKWFHVCSGTNRLADSDIRNTRNEDNVSCARALNLDALKPIKPKEFNYFACTRRSLWRLDGDRTS